MPVFNYFNEKSAFTYLAES